MSSKPMNICIRNTGCPNAFLTIFYGDSFASGMLTQRKRVKNLTRMRLAWLTSSQSHSPPMTMKLEHWRAAMVSLRTKWKKTKLSDLWSCPIPNHHNPLLVKNPLLCPRENSAQESSVLIVVGWFVLIQFCPSRDIATIRGQWNGGSDSMWDEWLKIHPF